MKIFILIDCIIKETTFQWIQNEERIYPQLKSKFSQWKIFQVTKENLEIFPNWSSLPHKARTPHTNSEPNATSNIEKPPL